jgi:protein-S-isoprenylcysteine O-methyltransferase Ste14
VLQLRRRRRRGGDFAMGWFRWSRNPGLCGMFVFYLGLAAAFGAPVLWIGGPVYFANMHRRVRLEEAHLAAGDGSAWRDYAARVSRYLPLPGLR